MLLYKPNAVLAIRSRSHFFYQCCFVFQAFNILKLSPGHSQTFLMPSSSFPNVFLTPSSYLNHAFIRHFSCLPPDDLNLTQVYLLLMPSSHILHAFFMPSSSLPHVFLTSSSHLPHFFIMPSS